MSAPDTRPFHFQQFSLHHHRSTMKVGTDAVLLGIWTELEGVTDVLDIGTGCGIIPLLLAARSILVKVVGVELDFNSFEEAYENFLASPFAGRLQAFHADINNFVQDTVKKYDLVISNPPFFINDHRPEREGRKLARHTDTLHYDQLVEAALRLLKPGGRFSVVLPYRESKVFLKLAEQSGLHLQRRMLIFPKPCRDPNRVNLLLGNSAAVPMTEKFIIRNEDGSFTQQYLNTVKDFYLSS
jgi:tRNA1Val (adenine37-N6)-methyltransferase